MPETTKKIDISISWIQAIRVYVRLIESGTPEGRRQAIAELETLGHMLDDCGLKIGGTS